MQLSTLIFVAGFIQLSVLVASALVPLRLDWRGTLAPLPRLLRQLFWTYGAYVVMGIVFNGLVCILASEELATTRLGRIVCVYILVFWGARLPLQWVFDAKPFLTHWVLRVGDSVLTIIFATLVVIFTIATLRLVQ